MVPRAGLRFTAAALLGSLLATACTAAEIPVQSPDTILLVVNDNSPLSHEIGEYYAQRRGLPPQNICHIKASISEEISREDYDREIARPLGAYLHKHGLQESIYYIVTTAGVPLKISGAGRARARPPPQSIASLRCFIRTSETASRIPSTALFLIHFSESATGHSRILNIRSIW